MARGAHRILLLGCWSLLLGVAVTSVAAQGAEAATRAAIGELRSAVSVQRSGAHHDLLRALRALRDPSLAPLFSRLTSHEDAVIRINGILGLAELSADRRVDPWLISKLDSEANRLYAINLAIGLNLLTPTDLRLMLGWNDLQETPRLAILADLVRRREPVEPDEVRPLLASASEPVRTVASCLLVQLTDSREPFQPFLSRLETLDERARLKEELWLVSDIGRYRLDRLQWWLDEILSRPVLDPALEQVALASSLRTDTPRGVAAWTARLALARTGTERSRLGLLLFAAAAEMDIPPEPFARLRDGEILNDRIAAAGAALATPQTATDALTAVIDLDHWRSSEIVLIAAERLPAAQRVTLLEHAVRRMFRSDHRREEREAIAIRAIAMLIELDAPRALALLAEAEDDSRQQEALLMGLLASNKAEAVEGVKALRRIGLGRADSLALILIARHAASLSQAELGDLGAIASGQGRVSPSHQVQAAWLYLRHARRIELAMAELFSSSGGAVHDPESRIP